MKSKKKTITEVRALQNEKLRHLTINLKMFVLITSNVLELPTFILQTLIVKNF